MLVPFEKSLQLFASVPYWEVIFWLCFALFLRKDKYTPLIKVEQCGPGSGGGCL